MFDRQAIFDRVCRHLIKLDERSFKSGICSYRGDEGRQCAIGCLISDSDYDPDIEGLTPIRSLEYADVDRRSKLLVDILKSSIGAESFDDFLFLTELQNIHDETMPCNWVDRLARYADAHNLKTCDELDDELCKQQR